MMLLSPALADAGEPFYEPPGALHPGSGMGRVDEKVYEPGMRFPLEAGPAYPNSQVYGVGGYKGPSGSECDPKNYVYPWRDNYCEKRSWDMPLCPAGSGHQGQDIRAATCEGEVHWTVAAGAGTVTNIPEGPGEYATYIAGNSGTRYDYLHGMGTPLKVGQSIARADKVDRVSDVFGDTSTTFHTHFNLKQDVAGYGFVYVPPYMSLVESYKVLMGLGGDPPIGAFEQANCEALVGWAQDPDAPELSIQATLYFDGEAGDPNSIGIEVTADRYREDLCESLGSCAHGFAVEIPRSLRDDQVHPIFVYAEDDSDGPAVEIEASPLSFTCAPPPIPAGIRRWIRDPETLATWQLSPFWDMAVISDAFLATIPVGELLSDEPQLVRADGEIDVFLVDHGYRRLVLGPDIATRWGLDLADSETWPMEQVYALDLGPPLRSEPFMVKGVGPWIYLIDDPLESPGVSETGSGSAGDDGTDSGSGSNSSTASSGSESTGAGGLDDDEGCGCSTDLHDRSPGRALAIVALLGLVRRRRR